MTWSELNVDSLKKKREERMKGPEIRLSKSYLKYLGSAVWLTPCTHSNKNTHIKPHTYLPTIPVEQQQTAQR
jgi:hypothetical protein